MRKILKNVIFMLQWMESSPLEDLLHLRILSIADLGKYVFWLNLPNILSQKK